MKNKALQIDRKGQNRSKQECGSQKFLFFENNKELQNNQQ